MAAAFDPRNVTSSANRTRVEYGLPANTLHQDGLSVITAPAIALSNRGHETGDTFETLRAGSHGALPMVASALSAAPGKHYDAESETFIYALQHAQIGRADDAGPQGKGYQSDVAFTQDSRPTSDAVAGAFGVRRLTPRECERLQGFPDDYTAWGIDEQGRRVEMSDSVRYRMLGNAICRRVSAWIDSRVCVLTLGAKRG